MNIYIRKFEESDIPYKIQWINNPNNNKYLHYDLPLSEDKTISWYGKTKDKTDRSDFTIFYDKVPVGIIGLLNIDKKNKKAEYYITIGDERFKGKGIAYDATKLLIKHSINNLKLNKLYLYTDIENIPAQNFFKKVGFEKEGLLKEDLIYNGQKKNRYIYGLILREYKYKLKD